MNLYAEYIKERENADIEYNYKGFMTYRKEPNGVFILDAYVAPRYRKENVAKEFLDRIIKLTESEKVYTTTCLHANNWETAERVIIALGFEKMNRIGTLNYYIKEIK